MRHCRIRGLQRGHFPQVAQVAAPAGMWSNWEEIAQQSMAGACSMAGYRASAAASRLPLWNPVDEFLFVYGTLRRGYGHPLQQVLARDARFAGMARYAGRLHDVGRYPGAVPAPGSLPAVVGEMYELLRPQAVLPALDRYEGCTDRYDPAAEYRRERQLVQRADGSSVTAWIYLYNRPTAALPVIASGDYLRRN